MLNSFKVKEHFECKRRQITATDTKHLKISCRLQAVHLFDEELSVSGKVQMLD